MACTTFWLRTRPVNVYSQTSRLVRIVLRDSSTSVPLGRTSTTVAAMRYRVSPEVGAAESGGYRFLSLYELDCPPDQAVANLAAAGMGNADTYIELKGDGDIAADPLPLPDWFAGIRFASWNATGTGERIVAPD